MAENVYRKKKRKIRLFNFKGDAGEDVSITSQSLSTNYIPYLVFLAVLGIFYIANAHYAERVVRQTTQLEAVVDSLRSDYTTLKAEYDVYTSKQSEIAEKAQEMGLKESDGKIQKIEVEKGEY